MDDENAEWRRRRTRARNASGRTVLVIVAVSLAAVLVAGAFAARHLVRDQVTRDALDARTDTAGLVASVAVPSSSLIGRARAVRAARRAAQLARRSHPAAEVVLQDGRGRPVAASASPGAIAARRLRAYAPIRDWRGKRVGTVVLATPDTEIKTAVGHWVRRINTILAASLVLLAAALMPLVRSVRRSLRRAASAERERAEAAVELERALRQDEFILHFQPIADASTGRVASVEALVRWQHPDRGLLGPDVCLALAEKDDRMWDLTLRTIDLALAQARRWGDLGLDLAVAVNLAASTVLDPRLADELEARLTRFRVSPGRLELEITESAVMDDPARAGVVLSRLRELGVGIVALDDFGTGYSSLGRLEALPLDALKIDREFVVRFQETGDSTMVRSIVDLAHDLGLRVVAEGVEDLRTWQLVQAIGCDAIQGYVLTRPLPAPDFAAWMREHPERKPAGARVAARRCRRCGERFSDPVSAIVCPRCGGPLVASVGPAEATAGRGTHARLELVRRAFTAVSGGERLSRFLDPAAVITPSPALLPAGSRYTGKRAFEAARADARKIASDFRLEVDALWDLGSQVFVSGRVAARRHDGRALSAPAYWLVEVEGDRIRSVRGFETESEAFESLRPRARVEA